MKINYRQMSILVFMSFISLKFFALPSLMYSISESMSLFVAVVIMVIDAIFLYFIVGLIKKSGNRNIYEFMSWCLGKPIAKVILVVLILRYALVVVNITKGLEFFIVENLYKEFDWKIYIIPLMILVGFMSYKGIRNVARVHEMVWWFILGGLIYITIKAFNSVDFVSAYLPLFNVEASKLFLSGFTHMNWFGSGVFLFMLFGNIDFSNEKKFQLFKFVVMALVIVSFIYLVFYGLFDITSPIHNFCLSDITEYSSGKSSIDNLSWLIVSLWIVAQVIQLALYSYCLASSIKFLFEIKTDFLPVIFVLIFILSWAIVSENSFRLEEIFLSIPASIIAIVSEYFVPLILWLGVGVKNLGKRKKLNEEIKNNF